MTLTFTFYLLKIQFINIGVMPPLMVVSKDTKNICMTFNAKYAIVVNTDYISQHVIFTVV